MKSKLLFFIVLVFAISSAKSQTTPPGTLDSTSAINLASQNWLIRFGSIINEAKPFFAQPQGDSVWVVKGTLKGNNGGVPFARIRKSDGKLIEMYWKERGE